MKQHEKELPLTKLQIARIVGGTKEMVRRYSIGDHALPEPVLQNLHDLFRAWEQVCASPDAVNEMTRPSEVLLKNMKSKIGTEMKQAEWEMLKAELTLEEKEDDLLETKPLYALVQKLCTENKGRMAGNNELIILGHRLGRLLDSCGMLQQLMIRYRAKVARNRLQIASAFLCELELLEKALYEKGKKAGAAITRNKAKPPFGEDTASLN